MNGIQVSYSNKGSSLSRFESAAFLAKPDTEYACASVRLAEFAGRNWNAGEVIEIVLRRPDGSLHVAPTVFEHCCRADLCTSQRSLSIPADGHGSRAGAHQVSRLEFESLAHGAHSHTFLPLLTER